MSTYEEDLKSIQMYTINPILKSLCEEILSPKLSNCLSEAQRDVARIFLGDRPLTAEMVGLRSEDLLNKFRKQEAKSYWKEVREKEFYE